MEQQKRQWMERQQEKKELQEFFQAIDDRKQDLVQARSAFDHERFVSVSTFIACVFFGCNMFRFLANPPILLITHKHLLQLLFPCL